MSENGTISVELGGTVPLPVPGPFALRLDLYWAAGRNQRRGPAAALGLCWAGADPPKAQIRRYGEADILEYGGLVMDELIARGISWDEIQTAAIQAWALIAESVGPMLQDLPTAEEVHQAEDFTEAAAAGGIGSQSRSA